MNPARRHERLAEAFWLVPGLCLLAAGGLALGLVRLDRTLQRTGGGVAFTGGPSSARELLSAIATSTLTFTGLVFSITIVVLQLTSSQFSPRVLRTFVQDRFIQLALGVFLATFVYALVALREVRGEDGAVVDRFVPGVTVTVGFGLAVASVATFVRYVSHIAQSIRVVNIIERIAAETEAAIDRCYPADGGPGSSHLVEPPPAPVRVLASAERGVVVGVQVDELVEEAARAGCVLRVVPAVGDFVPRGAPLAEVAGAGDPDGDRVRAAIALGRERTVRQDVGFGFRQLVDVAEKALSPGVNDPTTAVQCLDQVHSLLRQLATRPFPSGVHADRRGAVRLVVATPSWSDYVHLALDEVRHWGAGSLQVQRRLRDLLEDLATVVDAERRPPLEKQRRLLEARLQDLPEPERPLARGGGADGRGAGRR